MIDNRIFTFLELCNVMNYHKTAQNLNMTQPAVTQHIKYLENNYNCKLFNYEKKKLVKTDKCAMLEKYARTILSLNNSAKDELSSSNKEKTKINIGATKTIGEYMLKGAVNSLYKSKKHKINITIDNTENLLIKLNHSELDILMLEGYVNKEKYKHLKISCEELVGICAPEHPFAGKEIPLEEIISQNIILREKGSGTRAVFENYLTQNGYTVDVFKNQNIISSNKLIEHAVQNNFAISFVYSIIPKNNRNIAVFRVLNSKITHEFNYVYFNEEKAQKTIKILNGNSENT